MERRWIRASVVGWIAGDKPDCAIENNDFAGGVLNRG